LSSQVIDKLRDKPHLFEKFIGRLTPFDHVVLVYCWIIIILTINFARPINDYLSVLLFHFGMILLVCVLAQFARKLTNRLVVFIRLLYPVVMMAFFYQFSGKLVQAIVPRFFDGQLVGLEKSILGVHPTLWLDHHLNIVVTELLSAAYFSYYLLIPGLALFLFFGKRDGEIRRFMTATCVTFFISYLMFIFYPVVGPRFYFAELYQNEITGIIFRPLVNFVIDNAAFKGGAMPSSHCAEALIVMLFAIRNYGRKAYFLILVVIGLSLGTVYGRFHYVSDVIVGIALAFIIYWLTLKFYPTKKDYAPKWQLSDFDKKRMYVSNSV
jgi:membrane-associated phospholipid phosphatase